MALHCVYSFQELYQMAKFKLDVLIADDHKLVRDGIRYTLLANNRSGRFGKIHEASSGRSAIMKARKNHYDIILLDITFPDISGIEVATEILRKKPDSRIISLTMHGGDFEVRSMIKAGVMGYVLKNTRPKVINEAIKKVMEGENYFCEEVAKQIKTRKYRVLEQRGASAAVFEGKTTKRQRQILKMVAQGMTNEEIGQELSLRKRTVDTHRQALLDRFGVHNTAGLITAAYRLGYLEKN